MLPDMQKKLELAGLILLIIVFVFVGKGLKTLVTSEKLEVRKGYTVVIDPGHGGEDPGKVGINGELEKDINLQIAMKVRELLESEGMKVVMTREDDRMLAGDGTSGKKAEDLKERIRIIDDAKADLAVSIHQNSYTSPDVNGAQVFYYSHSEEGKRAAEVMQSALLSVNPQNHRTAKANDSYYLLTRTKTPVIIVECGFLSNLDEAEKLIDEEYQTEISNAIGNGIHSCLAD